jgi:hypothetical protein
MLHSKNIKKNKVILQGFVESHKVENCGWIFTRTINDKGYVIPRK